MDPLTASTTFATLVSLLGDYVGRRESIEARSVEEFAGWLAANRHEELAAMLRQTGATAVGIKALLAEGQGEILARLAALDQAFAAYASGFAEFRALAASAHPGSILSAQALSILQHFHDSGATRMLEHPMQREITLVYLDAHTHGNPVIEEPRFIEDDLSQLAALGLLDLSFNPSGKRIFKFTRAAARLADALKG